MLFERVSEKKKEKKTKHGHTFPAYKHYYMADEFQGIDLPPHPPRTGQNPIHASAWLLLSWNRYTGQFATENPGLKPTTFTSEIWQ